MSVNMLEKELCTELGKQLFHAVGEKLLLLHPEQSDTQSFHQLLASGELSDMDLLKEGFLEECRKHAVSRNEAEFLFETTKQRI